ncbi:hypothetical protein ATCR1_06706 [Agrobacterium tumefaciens CCNWGS0286]|uniref:DUF6074 family protein n=1 Tax=Agrobacterium tumefaciens TaxID=358 RepID=UPI0002334898|nr:DUF6074 family protein [Agrobacterium tumefaciens]EHH07536.1 hypothetical protein ATCR1_06706 [Agrobacterium tumefaciens CCNWGS0286]
MGKVLDLPIDTWARHVRVVADYVDRHEAAMAERFFATETRRLAVALQSRGLTPAQIEAQVGLFVADVSSQMLRHREAVASGYCAEIRPYRRHLSLHQEGMLRGFTT